MAIELRGGATTEDPRLDFIPYKDEESRNYAAVAVIDETEPKTTSYSVDKWLDQGQEGACVGFAFTHELCCPPLRVDNWGNLNADFARKEVYWPAQKIDEWPGGSYPGANPFYEGTSILAGVKIIQKMGYITEYRWAFGEDDLALAISHLGPAVIGVNWYEGMHDIDNNGFIQPSGEAQGGHAILVSGINVEEGYYELWNSWGKSWGKEGKCYITRDDMARLLEEQGEACIPMVRSAQPEV